jgi:hypothetical protein
MKPWTLLVALASFGCAHASGLKQPVGHSELTSAPAPSAATPGAIDLHLERQSAELCAMTDADAYAVTRPEDVAIARLSRCVNADATRNSTVVLIGRAPTVSSTADVDLGLRHAVELKDLLVARGVPETRVLATSAPSDAGGPSRVDVIVAFPPEVTGAASPTP